MMRAVYMEVTKDKYELPLAVADNPYELAKLRLVNPVTIFQATSTTKKNPTKKSKYKKVWIETED